MVPTREPRLDGRTHVQASLDGQVQVLDGVKAGTTIVVHSEKDIGARSRIKIVEALTGRPFPAVPTPSPTPPPSPTPSPAPAADPRLVEARALMNEWAHDNNIN